MMRLAWVILVAIMLTGCAGEMAAEAELPQVTQYWVVDSDGACSISWETQIWASRILDEMRRDTGTTTVVLCAEGIEDPELVIPIWISESPYVQDDIVVWLIQPDKKTVFLSGSVDQSILDLVQQSVIAGDYEAAVEEIVEVEHEQDVE